MLIIRVVRIVCVRYFVLNNDRISAGTQVSRIMRRSRCRRIYIIGHCNVYAIMSTLSRMSRVSPGFTFRIISVQNTVVIPRTTTPVRKTIIVLFCGRKQPCTIISFYNTVAIVYRGRHTECHIVFRPSISFDLRIVQPITLLPNGTVFVPGMCRRPFIFTAGITFDRVDICIVHLGHNTNMIAMSSCRLSVVIPVRFPVKNDQVTLLGREITIVYTLTPIGRSPIVLNAKRSGICNCTILYNRSVNSRLSCTPRHKHGTPCIIQAIKAPVFGIITETIHIVSTEIICA